MHAHHQPGAIDLHIGQHILAGRDIDRLALEFSGELVVAPRHPGCPGQAILRMDDFERGVLLFIKVVLNRLSKSLLALDRKRRVQPIQDDLVVDGGNRRVQVSGIEGFNLGAESGDEGLAFRLPEGRRQSTQHEAPGTDQVDA